MLLSRSSLSCFIRAFAPIKRELLLVFARRLVYCRHNSPFLREWVSCSGTYKSLRRNVWVSRLAWLVTYSIQNLSTISSQMPWQDEHILLVENILGEARERVNPIKIIRIIAVCSRRLVEHT